MILSFPSNTTSYLPLPSVILNLFFLHFIFTLSFLHTSHTAYPSHLPPSSLNRSLLPYFQSFTSFFHLTIILFLNIHSLPSTTSHPFYYPSFHPPCNSPPEERKKIGREGGRERRREKKNSVSISVIGDE